MPTIIQCTLSASNAESALARVERHLAKLTGFTATGRVAVRDHRHGLMDVEVTHDGTGDVDDAWVILTSYGISPSDGLGSRWSTVKGVGR